MFCKCLWMGITMIYYFEYQRQQWKLISKWTKQFNKTTKLNSVQIAFHPSDHLWCLFSQTPSHVTCIYIPYNMCFPLSRHRLHFNSRCKCGPAGTELTISPGWSAEGQTTSPQPAAPLLAPSNHVNVIHTFHWRHKEDKLSQVSNLSSSWGPSPSSWYLSDYNHLCLTLAVTHCLVCLPALVMDEASYISHPHTHSQTVTQPVIYESVWSE